MLILRSPRARLELTRSAEDWQAFLAAPDKHWKEGRSARMLAEAWEAASPGMPPEVEEAFEGTPFERFTPLLAIPEYEVALAGGRRPSQNDLFVLGRIDGELAVIMVEGKVDESFGPEVSLSPELTEHIDSGFGPSKDAEDPFDALLGLLSMIEVALGHRLEGTPEDEAVREMEGWILGQAHSVSL